MLITIITLALMGCSFYLGFNMGAPAGLRVGLSIADKLVKTAIVKEYVVQKNTTLEWKDGEHLMELDVKQMAAVNEDTNER